jgi:hypothetical protein
MSFPCDLPKKGDGAVKKADAPPARDKAPSSPRHRGLLLGLSFLGVASLSYLLGAAVIFFDLPSSPFLRRAFVGGVSWYERKDDPPSPSEQLIPLTVGQIDKPDKTCDGFTLCMYSVGTKAVLINMRGEVVHQWHVPFSAIWPAPPHLRGEIKDASVYFNDGHLYPNGDLVVVIEGPISVKNPPTDLAWPNWIRSRTSFGSMPRNVTTTLMSGRTAPSMRSPTSSSKRCRPGWSTCPRRAWLISWTPSPRRGSG